MDLQKKNIVSILKGAARSASLKKREFSFPYHGYHRRNNCVFIHVPKSAGTSVLQALGKKNGGRDHLPWYVYYTANPSYFAKAFKFSFVRNPWSKALSAYSYLKYGGNQKGDLEASKIINQYGDFDDFIINGLGRGHFRNHLLFLPQSEFVVNGAGNVVVDFLGRFENLEKDFLTVAKKLHLKHKIPITNQGVICHQGYRAAYQKSEAVEVVGNIYSQDVRIFGYDF